MSIQQRIINIPIATKIKWFRYTAYFALVMSVVVLLFFISMLSAIRASVGAQGIWEKQQKLVHTHLTNYIYSGDRIHQAAYQEAYQAIMGYEQIRREVYNNFPNQKESEELLIQLGNHPDDIPGMIFLFKHFDGLEHISNAMEAWSATTPYFNRLNEIYLNVSEAYQNNRELNIEEIIPEVESLNAQLTAEGARFSRLLGEGSRWFENLVFWVIVILSIDTGIGMIWIFSLLGKQISTWLEKLTVGANQLEQGNLEYQIDATQRHEFGELAKRFNAMSQSLRGLLEEKKNIETHLRELSLVASETDNAIFICNAEGYIEWVNRGFEKLSGYKAQDVIGTRGEILTRNAQGTTSLSPDSPEFLQMRETGDTVRYERENFHASGRKYWALTTLTPVKDEYGNLLKVIAVDVDISKIKMSELALQKAKDLAVESEQAKHQFLANMSHEIRTPMNAIIGFTDLLESSKLNPSQQESVEAIKSSGENLLHLINDILDLSKIQAGEIQLESIDFNLKEVCEKACNLFKEKAKSKNLKCQLEWDDNLSEWVKGDPYRFNQILTNLISNAIKFTHEGEVSVRLNQKARTENEVMVCLEVKDSGIGIPKHLQSKVFDNFSQANSQITRKFGGTGLGLSIVKQLVNRMGGQMSLESEEGKGSMFSAEIPFELISQEDYALPAMALKDLNKQPEIASLVDIKILVVEDNPVNQLLATRVLSGFGAKVDIAENGKVALEKLKDAAFDLVLMDLQMPELDGYQTTQQLREMKGPNQEVRVIAMTAHVLPGEKERCIEAGMNDYISKPFAADKLKQKIEEQLHISGNH